MNSNLQEEDTYVIHSLDEITNFDNGGPIQEGVFIQKMLSDLLELKGEIINLRKEVIKNKKTISQLEERKNSYGKEVAKRVNSMLVLINDYGGAMISTDAKEFMGLSKDEFYRTLHCAKNKDLIELLPNHKDGRSYIIKLKSK